MSIKIYEYDGKFEFEETSKESFFSAVLRCMNGETLGCIAKNYCSNDECNNIFARFESHPDTRLRSGDAQGLYLGTFHWRKSLEEYRSESQIYSDTLSSFSSKWNKIMDNFGEVAKANGKGIESSKVLGRSVCTPLIRSWAGNDEFALIPHEDLTQCFDPDQSGWEVQQGESSLGVFSLNLCIKNEGGGELIIWDKCPTNEEKIKFGTNLEGGPYPVEYVSNAKSVKINIATGDLYFFNGGLIHAVQKALGYRSTISCLARHSNRDRSKILLWT